MATDLIIVNTEIEGMYLKLKVLSLQFPG